MADLTAEQEALLRGTSDEALLTTFASLTHRLDSIGRLPGPSSQRDQAASEVRIQRDVMQAEILRRMAPTVVPGHQGETQVSRTPSGAIVQSAWRCTCGASGTSDDPEAAFTAHLTEAVAR